MRSNNLLKAIVFLALCLNGWAAQAKCSQDAIQNLATRRYTDIGGGMARADDGNLLVKQGFVVHSGFDISASGDDPDITPDVLSQVNGQIVMRLSNWFEIESGSNFDILCNYSRSLATYTIFDAPWVIVTVKQATVKKPKVSISASDPSASETAGDPGQFLISLNAPSDRGIRVKLETSGKAKRNRDYTGISKAVFVPAGSVSAVVNVVPVDDTAVEGPETVIVKLPSGGNSYSARGKASLVINDND